jgi:hypothetical protein
VSACLLPCNGAAAEKTRAARCFSSDDRTNDIMTIENSR